MKTKTKALVLTLCAALLVVTTVFATIAFLTSTDKVTNTFTVGNVKITLDEAKVDEGGEEVTVSAGVDAPRVQANAYKLMPNHYYVKDPTIHVDANSEDCWLFVKLENGLKDIIVSDDAMRIMTIEAQMTENGWICIDEEYNVYARTEIAKAGDDVDVFSCFKIKSDIEADALEDYADAQIIVTAYAVQADGLNFDAATGGAAYNAIKSQITTAPVTEAPVVAE